jgi:hypothetical protein
MKKFVFIVLMFFVVAAFLFLSCAKDSKNPTSPNQDTATVTMTRTPVYSATVTCSPTVTMDIAAATQTQVAIEATQTQVAIEATQTQVAADATATQVSVDATATQVSVDATATQVSVNATATQVAVIATATAGAVLWVDNFTDTDTTNLLGYAWASYTDAGDGGTSGPATIYVCSGMCTSIGIDVYGDLIAHLPASALYKGYIAMGSNLSSTYTDLSVWQKINFKALNKFNPGTDSMLFAVRLYDDLGNWYDTTFTPSTSLPAANISIAMNTTYFSSHSAGAPAFSSFLTRARHIRLYAYLFSVTYDKLMTGNSSYYLAVDDIYFSNI